MDLGPKEKQEKYLAEQWAKNKQHVVEVFNRLSSGRTDDNQTPAAIFMAGSPGAGKTEVSKELIKRFSPAPIRIDADEFRNYIPGYSGTNSYLYQGAATVMVQKVLDRVFTEAKHDRPVSFLLDGTFSYARTMENLKRTTKYGYAIDIYYVYQEPGLAWRFTKARERAEGRTVPKDVFIHAFVQAREHVLEAKDFFGDKVQVSLILKDLDAKDSEVYVDVDRAAIAARLPKSYTEAELRHLLKHD